MYKFAVMDSPCFEKLRILDRPPLRDVNGARGARSSPLLPRVGPAVVFFLRFDALVTFPFGLTGLPIAVGTLGSSDLAPAPAVELEDALLIPSCGP